MCALASLAKGPAGIALPGHRAARSISSSPGAGAIVIFKLEIPRGVVLFVASAFPWYHAMLIRHGDALSGTSSSATTTSIAPRGRHGDRGTFDYYLQYIGYGMFPWSGLVTLAGALSFAKLRERACARS